ncbi:hypothetical protein [Ferruginibacter sp. HRS2-29]|uniref:hypothetical protein n=1 Tax=Ferruginibacter sp. HRS2-29 TaxID=2487334 RepID=UPI0020CEE8A9|nr:hypothetical protein [Ferruginibacter sp. HRS2-29]MCP9751410.1 hypothetical protein [Ferruginibacter sp. HRS2-29]
MNLKNKKIIAREILIFLSTLVISLVTYGVVSVFTNYHSRKITSIQLQIDNTKNAADNLSLNYNSKLENQIEYAKVYYEAVGNSEESRKYIFFNKSGIAYQLKDGNLQLFDVYNKIENPLFPQKRPASTKKINSKKKGKTNSFDELDLNEGLFQTTYDKKYIQINTILPNDLKSKNESNNLYSKIDSLKRVSTIHEQKVFDNSELWDCVFSVLILTITILFGVRYVIYMIKWSIKTLKQ